MKWMIRALCIFTLMNTMSIPVNASSVIRWGLYQSNPGEIPQGEATTEFLAEYDAYFHGFAEGKRSLFLTFDAGYEDGNTEKILDSLKEMGIPAAFFVTGSYIKHNPDIVKRIVDDGHLVCNHTMTHPDTTQLNSANFSTELKKVEEEYKAIVGSEMPKYYRPPSGVFSQENLRDAKAMGYKTVLWSIAYRDWHKEQPTHKEAFSKTIPKLHPGAIVLLHTTSTTNAAILAEWIEQCHELGYIFRNLDDLPQQEGQIHYSSSSLSPFSK